MRRKWPVLTAAIPLAFGWAVADMASDGSFSVNYAGPASRSGSAFRQRAAARRYQ